MSGKFVVVITNPDRRIAVIGTKTGRVFASEKSAAAAVRRVERHHPTLYALAIEIEPEEG